MLKRHPVLRALLILLFGTTLSLGSIWLISGARAGTSAAFYMTAKTGISLVVSFVIPVGLVLYALSTSLRVQTKTEGLTILLLSYLSLVLSFGSVYYSAAFIGDLRDTTDQYYYYRYLQTMWPKDQYSNPTYRTSTERAFRGMDAKLWLGIEDYARPYYYASDMKAPVRDIMKLTEPDLGNPLIPANSSMPDHTLRFNPDAQREVFLDCLHYSIVTMATVGYGDLTPQSRLAKVMTDIQIVSGQLLFVFALGTVFGKVGAEGQKKT